MILSRRLPSPLEAVVIWSIVGYPALAVITSVLSLDNSFFSAVFRALFAFLSLLIIATNLRRIRFTSFLILFLCFWLAYFFRLYVSLYVFPEEISIEGSVLWMWALGACFVPALAVLTSERNFAKGRLENSIFVIAIATSSAIVLIGGTAFVSNDGAIIDQSRFGLASLNPISTGHLGATTALLAISLMMTKHNSAFRLSAFVFGSVIGTLLMVLANSRGPLISFAFSLLILFISRAPRFRHALIAFVAIGTLGVVADSNSELVWGSQGVLSRMELAASDADLSYYMRKIAAFGAIQQFINSPLFGDGIEERLTRYYPHNPVLEAFMATGLIGGLPFLFMTMMAMYAAWKNLRTGSAGIWIGLITIQYIVGAQFSGALYLSSTMWIMMVLSAQFFYMTMYNRSRMVLTARPGILLGQGRPQRRYPFSSNRSVISADDA